MKRTLLALLLVALPSLSAGQSDAPVPRPEVKVGDRWTYRGTNILGPGDDEHETVVHRADGKVLQIVSTRKSDGKEIDSIWTADWNAMTSYTGFIYRPSSGISRFPMRVGDKHTTKFEVLRPRANTITQYATMTVLVAEWEMVEVPAGKFRALKVEASGTWQQADGAGAFLQQITFWYVPEVRRWVKLEASSPRGRLSEELVAYKLQP